MKPIPSVWSMIIYGNFEEIQLPSPAASLLEEKILLIEEILYIFKV